MPRKKKDAPRKTVHAVLRLEYEDEARVWDMLQSYIDDGKLSEYLRDLLISQLPPRQVLNQIGASPNGHSGTKYEDIDE